MASYGGSKIRFGIFCIISRVLSSVVVFHVTIIEYNFVVYASGIMILISYEKVFPQNQPISAYYSSTNKKIMYIVRKSFTNSISCYLRSTCKSSILRFNYGVILSEENESCAWLMEVL